MHTAICKSGNATPKPPKRSMLEPSLTFASALVVNVRERYSMGVAIVGAMER